MPKKKSISGEQKEAATKLTEAERLAQVEQQILQSMKTLEACAIDFIRAGGDNKVILEQAFRLKYVIDDEPSRMAREKRESEQPGKCGADHFFGPDDTSKWPR